MVTCNFCDPVPFATNFRKEREEIVSIFDDLYYAPKPMS